MCASLRKIQTHVGGSHHSCRQPPLSMGSFITVTFFFKFKLICLLSSSTTKADFHKQGNLEIAILSNYNACQSLIVMHVSRKVFKDACAYYGLYSAHFVLS